MPQRNEYIWYACYGSNILEDRFLCYIQGGRLNGSTKIYLGCKDKTLPLESRQLIIHSELYFAKHSQTWGNGGVCFIKTNFDPNIKTLGRMYLITKEQFMDVVKQETSAESDLHIDFSKAISEVTMVFREKSWYGKIIYLGMDDSIPILTFTNQDNIEPSTKPSKQYLKTISEGIKEIYNLRATEIADYLISKSGISENYTKEELMEILENLII